MSSYSFNVQIKYNSPNFAPIIDKIIVKPSGFIQKRNNRLIYWAVVSFFTANATYLA